MADNEAILVNPERPISGHISTLFAKQIVQHGRVEWTHDDWVRRTVSTFLHSYRIVGLSKMADV